MKRSKWFPVSQKPDLPGVYEYLARGYLGPTDMKWDGKDWRTKDWGGSFVRYPTRYGDEWRGLAEKPEE